MTGQRFFVFIAGPLETGGIYQNVHNAVQVASRLLKQGFLPYLPHICVQWAFIDPSIGYEDWMAMDFAWVSRCDALFRLPGLSHGADREVTHAKNFGIPVFYDFQELEAWADVKRAGTSRG